jgi:hypothetical protein
MKYQVLRDGVVRATVETANEAFIWLIKQVPYSTYHALTYEGWEIKAIVEEEVA